MHRESGIKNSGYYKSMKKLRIAQLILPWFALPVEKYGGTERIVFQLTEELVKRGHDVTLFSVGETKTSAKLEYVLDKPAGLQKDVMATLKSSFYLLMHVANCFEKSKKFDIIHSHAQLLPLPFAASVKTPSLHTFHRTFEFEKEDERAFLMRYGFLPFTSLSNSHRIPGLNFIATVYNGIDTNVFVPSPNPRKDYLFWAGRIIDKKGPLEAIQAAQKTQIPLIMAGKITDEDYFNNQLKPHIDGKLVKYIGEIPQQELIGLYQNALATLFPIKWSEPFGLVMTESMACGTPVVAFNQGSVPEVLRDGLTGFIVEPKAAIEGLADAIGKTDTIKRENCRKHIEKNFTIDRMVDEYEKLYHRLANV